MVVASLFVWLGVIASPVHARASCGAQIASARWVKLSPGMRLIVTPTTCGRRTATRSSKAAFDEAIARGGRAHVGNRGSMYWQFVCHAEFATTKATWDLEQWRPDVGFVRTVLAGCNP